MKLCEYIQTIASQAELSRKSGVSHASLSYFLHSKRGLSARTMAKIVKATGGLVTYEDLVAEMQENKDRQAKNR